MIRRLLASFLILTLLALVLSFAGRLHGAGDTLAVGRPVMVALAGLLSLILLFSGPRKPAVLGLVVAGYAGTSLIPQPQASNLPEGQSPFSVYQKNLLFLLPKTRPVVEDILTTGADVVTLQELHIRNRPILAELGGTYPHQHFCPFASVGGTAVLSRWPVIEGREICAEVGGLAAVQIDTPAGALWVVSLHLHWPFPFRQADQVASFLPTLQGLDPPVLIAGDFNMVPWSHTVSAIRAASSTKPAGYPGGTFSLSYHRDGQNLAAWIPQLPIDHVLIPKDATSLALNRREKLGSDHHGLVARFGIWLAR